MNKKRSALLEQTLATLEKLDGDIAGLERRGKQATGRTRIEMQAELKLIRSVSREAADAAHSLRLARRSGWGSAGHKAQRSSRRLELAVSRAQRRFARGSAPGSNTPDPRRWIGLPRL